MTACGSGGPSCRARTRSALRASLRRAQYVRTLSMRDSSVLCWIYEVD